VLKELAIFGKLWHFIFLFEQIVRDFFHNLERLFNLVRDAHVGMNYAEVVLDLLVHHVEGCHVLDEEHVVFIAI